MRESDWSSDVCSSDLSGPIDATLELNHPVIQLHQKQSNATSPQDAPPASDTLDPTSFQARLTERITLSTLKINNGSIAVERTEGNIALNDVSLKVGPLSMSTPTKQTVDLEFLGTMTEGPMQGKLGLDGKIAIDLGARTFKTDKAKVTAGDYTFTLSLDAAGDPAKMKAIPKALATLAEGNALSEPTVLSDVS